VQRHFRGFSDRSKKKEIEFASNQVIRDVDVLRDHIVEILNAFETREKQRKQVEGERKASTCDSLTSEWKIKHRLVKLRRQRAKQEQNIKGRGATVMQAIIRGFLARRSVRFLSAQRHDEKMQLAATAIQARAIYIITKKRVESKRKKERSESATHIQRIYRGWCERLFTRAYARRVENLVQKVRAATLLQSNSRGMLQRLRSTREQRRHLREEAAKKMQGRCRIMLARKTSMRLRKEKEEEEAAVMIQSVIRGRIDRKLVSEKRARRAEQEKLRARIEMERVIDEAVSISLKASQSALSWSDIANEAFLHAKAERLRQEEEKRRREEEEERLRQEEEKRRREEEEERLRQEEEKRRREEEEERLRQEEEKRRREEELEKLRKEEEKKRKEEEEEKLRKEKEKKRKEEEEEKLRKEKEKERKEEEEEKLRKEKEKERKDLVEEEKIEKEEEVVKVEEEEKEVEEEAAAATATTTTYDESVESSVVSIQKLVRGAIGRRIVKEKRNRRLEILRKNLSYLDKQPTQKIKKKRVGRPDRKYGSAVHYPVSETTAKE
jgi:hypothetical protein